MTQEDRDYLKDKRMLSDEIIDRYCLGLYKRGSEQRVSIPIADAGERQDRDFTPQNKPAEQTMRLWYGKSYYPYQPAMNSSRP